LSILDIILIILFAFGAYHGYKKGLILELITIIAFILAIIGGFKLIHIGMEYLSRMYDGFGSFLPFVAFLVIFVLIIILVNTIGSILKKIIDWTPLGVVDNFAGALLGILKWALGVSIVFWVITTLNFDFISDSVQNSKILPFTNKILTSVGDFISTIFPSFDDFINTLKELFESFAS
jgi:membrane protein required for colicin V production